MRTLWAGAASIAAVLALGSAAFASGAPAPSVDADQYTQQDVPTVAPGDEISIACSALAYSENSDVRVVLTVSAAPADTPAGYQKVLATDEQMLMGAVRVKIPNMPDLENRTVDLNVYVVSAEGAQACDGGQMKIADGLKKPVLKEPKL